MEVYKVAKRTRDDEVFKSYMVSDELCATYRLGLWCTARNEALYNGFGLTVFDTEENAYKFIQSQIGSGRVHKVLTILKCIAEGHMELPKSRPPFYVSERMMTSLDFLPYDYDDGKLWPEGTIMFERVMPMRVLT